MTTSDEDNQKWYKEVNFPYHLTQLTGTRLTNGNAREEVIIYEKDHFRNVYEHFVSVYGVSLFQHYNGLQIIQYINKGSFGSIFLVMLEDRLYAVKIEEHILYDEEVFRKKIRSEFDVQRLCYRILCAPEPKEFGFFKHQGNRLFSCIFMRYLTFYKNTIGDILSSDIAIPKSFFKLLYQHLLKIFTRFSRYGIFHGDLHFNNLYIRTKHPIPINEMTFENTRLCILDFGHAGSTGSRLKLELLTIYRSTYIQNINHRETMREMVIKLGKHFGVSIPRSLGELNKQFNDEIINN